jgi:hypothetical protein
MHELDVEAPCCPGVHTSGADLLPEIYVFEL